ILCFRGSPCVFSTAAQQRSTGDECGPEDPHDEPKHPLSDCAIKHKAIKLEEQVRDLTERYRKALADSENVRRRTQKFVEDAKLFGNHVKSGMIFGLDSWCLGLLPVFSCVSSSVLSGVPQ
uniref:GrpE like 2, mitochondrial n=1 Tax=Amazona collaria TaxID=241587 RepID=A0A8B9ITW9_9PSIT